MGSRFDDTSKGEKTVAATSWQKGSLAPRAAGEAGRRILGGEAKGGQ